MSRPLDILFVEDSELVRGITSEFLLELGHRAVAVASGEEAMERLAQDTFDAMLTDVKLPGMSGITLVKHAAKGFPGMALIVSSGSSELTRDLLRAELGIEVSVLTKPYDMTGMRQVLEEALAQPPAA
jgi:CheY-like chemotaxis protein